MKKAKNNLFFKILAVLFLIYVAITIAYESGYYETKSQNRAVLTKEAIEKFEKDLEKGEVIDMKDYLVEERPDYSNQVTKIGNKISISISDALTKGISDLFGMLKNLFW